MSESSKLTIIKVGSKECIPTVKDLENIRDHFISGIAPTEKEMKELGIEVQNVELKQDKDTVTLIRIGGENNKLTAYELNNFTELFAQSKDDKDFKIFSPYSIKINQVTLRKGMKIFVSGDVVIA